MSFHLNTFCPINNTVFSCVRSITAFIDLMTHYWPSVINYRYNLTYILLKPYSLELEHFLSHLQLYFVGLKTDEPPQVKVMF